jgi:hypothetical protein
MGTPTIDNRHCNPALRQCSFRLDLASCFSQIRSERGAAISPHWFHVAGPSIRPRWWVTSTPHEKFSTLSHASTDRRYRWRTGFAGLKASAESFIVPSVMKYYVREPLLAILKGPASSVAFLTIKSGSVITVKGDDQACGFVEVDYQGQIVLALVWGIQLRAHRVRGTAI